jgi:hypothetical protein
MPWLLEDRITVIGRVVFSVLPDFNRPLQNCFRFSALPGEFSVARINVWRVSRIAQTPD